MQRRVSTRLRCCETAGRLTGNFAAMGQLRAWLDRRWDQSLVAFQAEVERQRASKQRERK
jgi:hypothetical protein